MSATSTIELLVCRLDGHQLGVEAAQIERIEDLDTGWEHLDVAVADFFGLEPSSGAKALVLRDAAPPARLVVGREVRPQLVPREQIHPLTGLLDGLCDGTIGGIVVGFTHSFYCSTPARSCALPTVQDNRDDE